MMCGIRFSWTISLSPFQRHSPLRPLAPGAVGWVMASLCSVQEGNTLVTTAPQVFPLALTMDASFSCKERRAKTADTLGTRGGPQEEAAMVPDQICTLFQITFHMTTHQGLHVLLSALARLSHREKAPRRDMMSQGR